MRTEKISSCKKGQSFEWILRLDLPRWQENEEKLRILERKYVWASLKLQRWNEIKFTFKVKSNEETQQSICAWFGIQVEKGFVVLWIKKKQKVSPIYTYVLACKEKPWKIYFSNVYTVFNPVVKGRQDEIDRLVIILN